MSSLPCLFAISAFVLSCFAGASCRFVEFASGPAVLKFGYWYYSSPDTTLAANEHRQTTGTCVLYPLSFDVDPTLKAARAFNIIAVVLGAAFLVLEIFQGGCRGDIKKRQISFRTSALGYLVTGLASGLSLMILNSDACQQNALVEEWNRSAAVDLPEECHISQGGMITIAACVLWFAAASGMAALHRMHGKPEQEGQGELDEPLFNGNANVAL